MAMCKGYWSCDCDYIRSLPAVQVSKETIRDKEESEWIVNAVNGEEESVGVGIVVSGEIRAMLVKGQKLAVSPFEHDHKSVLSRCYAPPNKCCSDTP